MAAAEDVLTLAHGHIATSAAAAAARRRSVDEAERTRHRQLQGDAAQYLRRLKAHIAKLELLVHRPEALLLGLLYVPLLINVDSHTRDDLLTLTTLRVCAHVLRPGLVLDGYTLSLLAELFEALGLNYGLMRRLTMKGARIVPTKRSGEWLLVDGLYADYLADEGKNHLAEPMGGVVKLQTLAHADLSHLEAALQGLAVSLGTGRQDAAARPRAQFFWALAAFAGACARSAFHENLATPFVRQLETLMRGQGLAPEALAAQATALMRLTVARTQLEQAPSDDEELARDGESTPRWREERASHRLDAFHEALPSLLDARAASDHAVLRRLVLFQLQLLSLARYLGTGAAAKLAFVVAAPDFTAAHASLYWLAELHAALSDWGLDRPALAHALRLLAPNADEPELAYMMTAEHAHRDLEAFRALLAKLVALLRRPLHHARAMQRFEAAAKIILGHAARLTTETVLFFEASMELLTFLSKDASLGGPLPASHRPSLPLSPESTPHRDAAHSSSEEEQTKTTARATEAQRAVDQASPPLPDFIERSEAVRNLSRVLTELHAWTVPETHTRQRHHTPPSSPSPRALILTTPPGNVARSTTPTPAATPTRAAPPTPAATPTQTVMSTPAATPVGRPTTYAPHSPMLSSAKFSK